MNKEEKYLINQIDNKLNNAEERYVLSSTDFLTGHLRALADNYIKSRGIGQVKVRFWGGYDDAEREALIFLPLYVDEAEILSLFSAVRVTKKRGSRNLAHGDYLGSLLGLGISRDKVGDILVNDNGADIIVMKSLESFIIGNYFKVGREEIMCSVIPIETLEVPCREYKEISDTVASLRLDNMISSAFGISRTKAAEAILQGFVTVDNREELRADVHIAEGRKLVYRGKGRAFVKSVGGTSRKGRIYVTFARSV